MFGAIFPEAFRALATQGTGWVLASLLLALSGWLLRRLLRLQETRIEEVQILAKALRDSADATVEQAKAIRDRTGAFDSLAAQSMETNHLVIQQGRDYVSNNERWRERVSIIEQMLREIQAEQREVRRTLDRREGRT